MVCVSVFSGLCCYGWKFFCGLFVGCVLVGSWVIFFLGEVDGLGDFGDGGIDKGVINVGIVFVLVDKEECCVCFCVKWIVWGKLMKCVGMFLCILNCNVCYLGEYFVNG